MRRGCILLDEPAAAEEHDLVCHIASKSHLAVDHQHGRPCVSAPPPTGFHEGSGKVVNTVPPNDWSFFEMLNQIVQEEPASSFDPELMGQLAAIGIVKGKPLCAGCTRPARTAPRPFISRRSSPPA